MADELVQKIKKYQEQGKSHYELSQQLEKDGYSQTAINDALQLSNAYTKAENEGVTFDTYKKTADLIEQDKQAQQRKFYQKFSKIFVVLIFGAIGQGIGKLIGLNNFHNHSTYEGWLAYLYSYPAAGFLLGVLLGVIVLIINGLRSSKD